MVSFTIKKLAVSYALNNYALPQELSAPIPITALFALYCGSTGIALQYACPVDGYNKWAIISSGKNMGLYHELGKHLKSTHKMSPKDVSIAPLQNMQQIMIHSHPCTEHYFVLPGSPFSDVPNTPSTLPSLTPETAAPVPILSSVEQDTAAHIMDG